MSGKYSMNCALNGVDILGLDFKLYVEDIIETPEIAVETAKRPDYGLFLVNNTGHDSLKITVKFMIKARRKDERMDIIRKVYAWATNGYLTVSYRPGLRVYVHCTKLPKAETFDWTNRMEIEFTAYNEAYWEDVEPVTETLEAATTASATIKPNGTRKCYLEADITNTSESSLTSVVLATANEAITLSGISVDAGDTVTIGYDLNHFLCIEADSVSLLQYRTYNSADDIMLTAGVDNTVTCTTNVECTTVFKARGLYR